MTINFAETQIAPVRAQQGQYIPEEVKRQLLAAQLLQQTSADSSQPVYSKGLGYAKLLAGGLGGLMEGYERNKEESAQRAAYDDIAKLYPDKSLPTSAPPSPSGGGLGALLGKMFSSNSDVPAAPQVASAAPAATPTAFAPADLAAGLDGKPLPSQASQPQGGAQFAPAIAGIESGGQKDPYGSLGPVTKTGDQAHGKYQVMGANVPSWTKEVLGKEMTPDEFRANPQAQDAVFNAKFGALAQKYGPEGAAKAWFAGEGGMNNPNAKDILGTTVSQYAQKFNSLNGAPPQGQPAPQQTAQAQPQAQPPAPQPSAQMDPSAVMRIIQNPRLPPELRTSIYNQFMNPQREVHTTPDGTMVSVDKSGRSPPVVLYQSPEKLTPITDEQSFGSATTGKIVTPSVARKAQMQQDATAAAGQPTASGQPSTVVPPPPPGADPKTWTKTYTEAASKSTSQNTLPAAASETAEVRKEVMRLPSYQNYSQAMPIYRSMLETSGRDSKASDLNLVYGLGKILDPGSVVREGELVMAKNTASLPDWLVGSINSLNGGAALTPETRQRILQEGYGRMKSYEDAFNMDAEHYKGVAERNRMNPMDVIPAFKLAEPYVPTSTNEGIVSQATGGRAAMPQSPQAGQQPKAPQPSAPVKVTSPADARKLPSGTHIILPDGSAGVVP